MLANQDVMMQNQQTMMDGQQALADMQNNFKAMFDEYRKYMDQRFQQQLMEKDSKYSHGERNHWRSSLTSPRTN